MAKDIKTKKDKKVFVENPKYNYVLLSNMKRMEDYQYNENKKEKSLRGVAKMFIITLQS